jgi:hypothetical protein
MGKVMSQEIMNKWIDLNTEYLEEKGKLMANEFLYLVANSHDRVEMV